MKEIYICLCKFFGDILVEIVYFRGGKFPVHDAVALIDCCCDCLTKEHFIFYLRQVCVCYVLFPSASIKFKLLRNISCFERTYSVGTLCIRITYLSELHQLCLLPSDFG